MKKLLSLLSLVGVLLTQAGCFQKQDFTFDEKTLVEFQEAITRTPATGQTYPLIAIANGAGATTTRVNLVGRQRAAAETVRVTVVVDRTTAVAGVHYNLGNDGTISIPANSSTGDCIVTILRAPAAAGQAVNLVLQLEGNGSDILPSENYKRIGYRIAL